VADDDPGVRQVLRRVLTADLRADVEEASDGLGVLAALQTATFDLLIMDIHMGPLDGLDTLEAIRRVPSMRALPVVMITGNADAARVTRLRELGVADIVAKPFSLSVLRERLAPLLSRPASPIDPARREPPRWRLRGSDRVVVVGHDEPMVRVIHSVLGQVCDVRHDTSVVTALREIARRHPSAVFLTSADPLLPPAVLAKAIRRSPAAQARLFVCANARTPESDAADDVFDGRLPHVTDALAFVRAIRPHVSDGSMARLLLSAGSLLADQLTEATRALLERAVGEPLRILAGPPSAGVHGARSVEVTATFDVDNQGWRLRLLATQQTAIRNASRVFGGNADAVSEAAAHESIAELCAEIAKAICGILSDHAIGAQVRKVDRRHVHWIDSELWESHPGPEPVTFTPMSDGLRLAVRIVPPRA
jgi:two-component system chemotaxis response regulator CheY